MSAGRFTICHLLIPMVCIWPLEAGALAQSTPLDSANSYTQTDADIAQWVQQLGSQSYNVREAAQLRLIQAGAPALPHLRVAANNPDLEVRSSVERIQKLIEQLAPHYLAEEFIKASDDSREAILPGWQSFQARFEDRPDAAESYAQMHLHELKLMAALASDPIGVVPLFEERMDIEFERLDENLVSIDRRISLRISPTGTRVQINPPREQLGSLAALLYAAADDRVRISPERWLNTLTLLRKHPAMQANDMKPIARDSIVLELANRVVANVPESAATLSLQTAVRFSMEYALSSGAVPARMLLGQPEAHPVYKQNALLCLGRFGDANDLTTVQDFLTDQGVCKVPNNPAAAGADRNQNQSRPIEVRDIALGVLLARTGQELPEYSLPLAQTDEITYLNPDSLCFDSPDARDEAFAKWKAWTEENTDWLSLTESRPVAAESK